MSPAVYPTESTVRYLRTLSTDELRDRVIGAAGRLALGLFGPGSVRHIIAVGVVLHSRSAPEMQGRYQAREAYALWARVVALI